MIRCCLLELKWAFHSGSRSNKMRENRRRIVRDGMLWLFPCLRNVLYHPGSSQQWACQSSDTYISSIYMVHHRRWHYKAYWWTCWLARSCHLSYAWLYLEPVLFSWQLLWRWWDAITEDDGHSIGKASMRGCRIYQCLWLGHQLPKVCFISCSFARDNC